MASKAIPIFNQGSIVNDALFVRCSRIITANGDQAQLEYFVIVQENKVRNYEYIFELTFDMVSVGECRAIIGRVKEILSPANGLTLQEDAIVTLEQFYLGEKHGMLNMPTIHGYKEEILIRVPGKVW